MVRILSLFGRRLLWASQPEDGIVRECLSIARARGLADDLLTALIRPADPADPAVHLPQAVNLAVDLLNSSVFAGTGGESVFPRTRELLGGNPPLACEFIAGFARSGYDALQCLRWLESASSTAVFRIFAVALGEGRGALTEEAVATLAGSGVNSSAPCCRPPHALSDWATCCLVSLTGWRPEGTPTRASGAIGEDTWSHCRLAISIPGPGSTWRC